MSTRPPLPRRLVLFLDGTWNHPDQKDRGKTKPSNVTKLARAVSPVDSDGRSQIVYYDDGVGTSWGLDRWIGGGLGVGLARNVREAYRFLVYNYCPNDEIYLFGFSRGAWTARSLAGFIHRFGVLVKSDAFYIQAAFEHYVKRSNTEAVAAFLSQRTTREVPIQFIGVWDTVGSIGLPTRLFHVLTLNRWNYHDVSLVPNIHNAAHALAIDEKRRPFRPTLWTEVPREGQAVEQRWFVGAHSNIGGGYAHDGLANCALHWIADRSEAAGLELDREFLKPYKPFWGHELRNSFTWPYWLLLPALRTIGTTGTETIDPSVYVRYVDTDGVLRTKSEKYPYRPKNLKMYLKSHGLSAETELARS